MNVIWIVSFILAAVAPQGGQNSVSGMIVVCGEGVFRRTELNKKSTLFFLNYLPKKIL